MCSFILFRLWDGSRLTDNILFNMTPSGYVVHVVFNDYDQNVTSILYHPGEMFPYQTWPFITLMLRRND